MAAIWFVGAASVLLMGTVERAALRCGVGLCRPAINQRLSNYGLLQAPSAHDADASAIARSTVAAPGTLSAWDAWTSSEL